MPGNLHHERDKQAGHHDGLTSRLTVEAARFMPLDISRIDDPKRCLARCLLAQPESGLDGIAGELLEQSLR